MLNLFAVCQSEKEETMQDIIVMIHGMCMTGACWENYKTFFESRSYRCITPTLRYHDMNYNSPPDARLGTVGLETYAADLQQTIEALDARPILMGHSMGGLLVQILAARKLAKAAVLLTPAPPGGINALKFSVVRSFAGVMTRWGFWRKPFRFSYNKAIYALMNLLPPPDRQEIFQQMVYESGRAAFQIGYWWLDRMRAASVDAGKIDCPMFIVAGRHDRITPATVIRKIARKYEAVAVYREFENHAHMVLHEPGWEAVAGATAAWLENL